MAGESIYQRVNRTLTNLLVAFSVFQSNANSAANASATMSDAKQSNQRPSSDYASATLIPKSAPVVKNPGIIEQLEELAAESGGEPEKQFAPPGGIRLN